MTNILREILDEQIQNTTRRDFLQQNEKKQQQRWNEEKAFEFDAAEDPSKPKFFVTFPYPYMNGRLHLGHMFTITKADFASYYQRMKGKQSIFPFSFHVTGMPIKACADKLARELEIYGPQGPPRPSEEELEQQKKEIKEDLLKQLSTEKKEVTKVVPAAPAKDKKGAGDEFHSKKSKAVAKTGTAKTQWEIMRSIGLEDEMIVKFTDANFWLEYFPPHCRDDLKTIGVGIDWRRSFYTTPANPFYDKFVVWQFERLRQKNKLDFGERYTIFSPLDGQPCMDHDRQSGETVLPQKYTLIKMELLDVPEALQALKKDGQKLYLAAATLRPETMYGQTNCWVLPTGEYGAFQISEHEIYVISERSARNLAYQKQSYPEHNKVNKLATVSGSDLIGLRVKAPLSTFEHVYTLPMNSISMNKGTGIVTSVPSDSPDDFMNLNELVTKDAYRQKLNLKDEWILPYQPVAILETPKGDLTAPTICKEMKIASPNDRDKLAAAKETCYKLGFYDGVLKVGDFAGKKIADVKEEIKQQLLDAGLAAPYAEPENEVVSRSGDVCVVALTNQWFFVYGETEWRALAEKALSKLNTYAAETRHVFEHTLGWLDQWACSRTYGLGSKLPWDQQFLIESLSDSTIYMAYYTIAHLIQGGDYKGQSAGPHNIRPEQLTPEVFDYIFLQGAYPAGSTDIPEEVLAKLRKEFEYWYPMDLRVSGKDLVPNHLTFMLYNHVAMWDNDEGKWPLGIRGNGHLLLNNLKMSKQTGNFLTISDSVELFGADATRIALAHAGDGVSDANFSSSNANKAVLDLYNAITWAQDTFQDGTLVDRPVESVEDRTFDSAMNRLITWTEKAYETMNFREALLYAFYELRNARDAYRIRVGATNMNKGLIYRYIEVQTLMLVPIAPHWAEYVWTLLGHTGLAVHQPFPVPGPIDEVLLLQDAHLFKIRDEFSRKTTATKVRNPKLASATIYVAGSYPEWYSKVMELLKSEYESSGAIDQKLITGKFKNDPIIKTQMKLAVPLVKEVVEKVATEGTSAFNVQTPFDEKQLFVSAKEFLEQAIELTLTIADEDGSQRVKATPLNPTIIFN